MTLAITLPQVHLYYESSFKQDSRHLLPYCDDTPEVQPFDLMQARALLNGLIRSCNTLPSKWQGVSGTLRFMPLLHDGCHDAIFKPLPIQHPG